MYFKDLRCIHATHHQISLAAAAKPERCEKHEVQKTVASYKGLDFIHSSNFASTQTIRQY